VLVMSTHRLIVTHQADPHPRATAQTAVMTRSALHWLDWARATVLGAATQAQAARQPSKRLHLTGTAPSGVDSKAAQPAGIGARNPDQSMGLDELHARCVMLKHCSG